MLVTIATHDMVTVEPARNGEPLEPFKLRNLNEWTKLKRRYAAVTSKLDAIFQNRNCKSSTRGTKVRANQ